MSATHNQVDTPRMQNISHFTSLDQNLLHFAGLNPKYFASGCPSIKIFCISTFLIQKLLHSDAPDQNPCSTPAVSLYLSREAKRQFVVIFLSLAS
jgi:hypothetical protein